MLASRPLLDFLDADVTEERRKITDLSLDASTARVLEAGMKAATGPAAMKAHATATGTFKGLSYAIWLLPLLGFIWSAGETGDLVTGAVIGLFACVPAAFFSFIWGRIARGNEEVRKNLKDAGVNP